MNRWVLITYHASPIAFYVASALLFRKMAHAKWSFPLWRLGWLAMTAAAVLFSLVRGFNIVDALITDSTDVLLTYQTLMVLVGAACLFAGSWCFWRVLRLGKGL